MNNTPVMKIGIVAVSRDCFPESLSVTRRQNLVKAYEAKYGKGDIYECPVCIVESEIHMMQALEDIKNAGCNALCVYLGNFGPEIAETMLAKNFNGPKMFIAAAEETSANGGLVQGRGDAYCGMLNASYNLKLRGVKAYIPEYPVGTAEECADMIHEFIPVAKAVYALSNLKIISFGPRPNNFLACNAPIAGLYNLGVEIEENSELDLFESFNKHAGDERIPDVVRDMEKELGTGNKKPEILSRLAQYELTLTDWVESHKGSRKYVAVAGKCWPAFQTQFGCVPCYVNSRLTSRGIPVSCEVDIYGALSEFIGEVVSDDIVTLLDINNTVPSDIYEQIMKKLQDKNVTIIVDATKDLLLNVLKYHPFLIKPNHHELGEIFGVELSEWEDVVPYAKKLQEMGAVNVLVSMGGKGGVLLSEDGKVVATKATTSVVKNSVGAGDSSVAGFIAGWLQKKDYDYAFSMAMATGGASAASDYLATKQEVEESLKRVDLKHIAK